MIKMYLHFLAAGLLLLTSCSSGINEASASSSLEGETEMTYEFKDGEHIHWETSQDGDFVVVKAWLNKDWNTYSVFNTNLLGPLPTLISFEKSDNFELVGDIKEEGLKTKFDEESKSEIGYFKNLATFKQQIKVNSGQEFVIKGNVNYMICNATMCLPPADYNFELTVKP